MRKIFVVLALLFIGAPAYGQQVNLYCNLGTGGLNPWQPCSAANPLAVAATITPSGTQNVNLTQILSAAPSLTNPLWVFPATGATFPVSGTVAATQSGTWTVTGAGGTFPVTQSTSPWIAAGGGTAGTAATGVMSVQGIASMTPVQVTLPTTPLIASGNGVIATPTSVSTGATTRASGTAAASNLVLKASAGNLYDLKITIGATSGYVMLFDATSLPGNGAITPVFCDRVNSDGTAGGASYAWPMPFPFATGITAGFSTTGCFTQTASATAAFFGGYK